MSILTLFSLDMNPLAFNDSPFQKAAIDFALNNSAGSAFKAFLSSPEGKQNRDYH